MTFLEFKDMVYTKRHNSPSWMRAGIYKFSELERIKYLSMIYNGKHLEQYVLDAISKSVPEYDWIKPSPSDKKELMLKHLILLAVDELWYFMTVKTVFYKGKKLFNFKGKMTPAKKLNKLLSLDLNPSHPIRSKKHNSPNSAGDFDYFRKPMRYLTVYID